MSKYDGQDRIRSKVDLVIQPIDDFTDKPISTSDFIVSIEHQKKPIRKSEGYYVFTNISPGNYEVILNSQLYNQNSILVSVEAEHIKVEKVRMIPSRFYKIPRDTTCIEGRCEAMTSVRVFTKQIKKPFKLLYDYSNNNESDRIRIYHPEDIDIEGKTLYIEDKEGKTKEYFAIVGTVNDAENTYLLRDPLKNSYKKIGTSLFPVALAKSDFEGEFFLPIKSFGSKTTVFICETTGDKPVSRSIELKAGCINKIQLQGE